MDKYKVQSIDAKKTKTILRLGIENDECERLSAFAIINSIREISSCRRVTITGIEAANEIDDYLLEVFEREGFKVNLETKGSSNLGLLIFSLDRVTIKPIQSRIDTVVGVCHDLIIQFPYLSDAVTIMAFNSFNAQRYYLQPIHDENYEENLRLALIELEKFPKWSIIKKNGVIDL